MASAPLDSFVQQLVHIAVPIGIAAVVIGTAAALLFRGFESWFARFLRGLRPGSQLSSRAGSKSSDSPHCPECNSIIVARQARQGAHAGKRFWGCSGYPTCRGTRDM